jgi:hypothetical protein
MDNQTLAATRSPRCKNAPASRASSKPLSKLRPLEVAALGQIAEALEKLVKAKENQNGSVIQTLPPWPCRSVTQASTLVWMRRVLLTSSA